MGQYKYYISFNRQFLFGIEWDKGTSITISLGAFNFMLGLLDGAEGFGFWSTW